MSGKKLLTVFGATGNQGGSVLSVILASPELTAKYSLRGITRDPSSSKSQALASQGVEMVRADLTDPSSLGAALKASYAVFGVTNYWESMDHKLEERQGKSIADAAFAAGVKHLVWASLPHVGKLTSGKLDRVVHFDGKANVEAYIEQEKEKHGTAASYVMNAVFMEQVAGTISKGADGQVALNLHIDGEKTHFPMLAAAKDTGKYVVGVLEAGPEKTNGVQVHAVGSWLTPKEITSTIEKVTGAKAAYNQIPRDTFKAYLPPAAAEELAQNFELIQDYSYFGVGAEKKQAESDQWLVKGSQVTTWAEYVKENRPWEKN